MRTKKLTPWLEVREEERNLVFIYPQNRKVGACWLAALIILFTTLLAPSLHEIYLAGFKFWPDVKILAFATTLIAGVGYPATVLLVNRVEISLNDQSLTVRHLPLRWPGNLELPLEQIASFTYTNTERGRGERYIVSWTVLAELSQRGGTRKLLDLLPSDVAAARKLYACFGECKTSGWSAHSAFDALTEWRPARRS